MFSIINNEAYSSSIQKAKNEYGSESRNTFKNISQQDGVESETKKLCAIKEGNILLNQKLTKINQSLNEMTIATFSRSKQNLPLARIKRIMRCDKNVRMISSETAAVFSKACELMIVDLACRSFMFAQKNKRKTIQKSDIKKTVFNTNYLDFILDIVEESYKKNINRYAQEFFSAILNHEKMIRKMHYPDFRQNNQNLLISQVFLDNSPSNEIVRMYLDHYNRYENNK